MCTFVRFSDGNLEITNVIDSTPPWESAIELKDLGWVLSFAMEVPMTTPDIVC